MDGSPDFLRTAPGIDAKLRFLKSVAKAQSRGPVEVLETHMSWVVLGDQRVYKLKKAVRYPPLLDFSSVDRRAFYCREEVRLNRRLAPQVYLGVLALQWGAGEFSLVPEGQLAGERRRVVDWVVLMQRLPADRMLDGLISRGLVTPVQIDALATVLRHFYRHAQKSSITGNQYLARFAREQEQNRGMLLRPRFQLADAGPVLDRMERALQGQAEHLRERVACGRIVEGHGDLRPEHVCLIDPPAVIDGLEFNESLRQVDPYDELSFLALECKVAGCDWIGPRLLARAEEALGDMPAQPLIHLYTAARALTRARLAVAHLLDARPRTPERWLPLARRYLQRAAQALDAAELAPAAARLKVSTTTSSP